MKPQYILLATLLGFPVVYFVPYGQWLVPAFWTLFSIGSIIRDSRIKKADKEGLETVRRLTRTYINGDTQVFMNPPKDLVICYDREGQYYSTRARRYQR